MRAVEVVARALARASALGKHGYGPNDEDSHAVRRFADHAWPDFEAAAKRLLRSLKDQPPDVAEAGAACVSWSGAINEVLEAMAGGEVR